MTANEHNRAHRLANPSQKNTDELADLDIQQWRADLRIFFGEVSAELRSMVPTATDADTADARPDRLAHLGRQLAERLRNTETLMDNPDSAA